MATPNIVESIAAAGSTLGPRVVRHLDRLFRLATARHGEGDERRLLFISGEPHPFGNVAILRQSDDPELARRVAEPLAELAVPSCVIAVGGPYAPSVHEALHELGFAPIESMPAMAVDIDALAPTALPSDCTFERVHAGDASAAWADALAVGYEIPHALAGIFAPDEIATDRAPDAAVQCFAAIRDGAQVATSLLYLADGLAGIYCVATRAEARGGGLGAYATAEPLRIARRLGYRVGVLQSSEMGHSVYRRLGFADIDEVPISLRMP